jgi:hypothetical protein
MVEPGKWLILFCKDRRPERWCLGYRGSFWGIPNKYLDKNLTRIRAARWVVIFQFPFD